MPMGVSLISKDKVREMSMPYSTFNKLREVIANIYDKDFGRLYSEHTRKCLLLDINDVEDCNIIADTADYIASKKGLSKGVRDFLWQSDCDGKITYKTCKDLQVLLKDKENNHIGFEPFKELIEYCVNNKQGMYWL